MKKWGAREILELFRNKERKAAGAHVLQYAWEGENGCWGETSDWVRKKKRKRKKSVLSGLKMH